MLNSLNESDNIHLLQRLIDFAKSLSDATGPVALEYFRNPLDIQHKADLSPVTIADRNVEAIMRSMITAEYPEHGIFGEEHGISNADYPQIWVLDPIDGTKSFITGSPLFGTLIAFVNEECPTIGVIDIPALNERWVGVIGQPTTLNNKVCQTSQCQTIEDANLYTTSVDFFNAEQLEVFELISSKAAMRRFGGDSYNYGLLASGYVDAVIEASLEPYDYLALVPVIEGAGGVITDWQGRKLTVNSDGCVIAAATQELHAEMLTYIG